MAVLEAQVKALQKDNKVIKEVVVGGVVFALCSSAITADALQGTWQTVDQLSAATAAGRTYFGPQAPVDDTILGQHACQALGITRSQAVPPSTAPFSALLAFYQH